MYSYAPTTRFDLRFAIFGIPVRVHPLFWLIILLLGGRANLTDTLAWIAAAFAGVLIHELGHALAMRFYGQRPSILLHAIGGLTAPDSFGWGSVRPTMNQEIVIVAAGPFAGFLFAAFAALLVLLTGGVARVVFALGFIPVPLAGYAGGFAFLNSFLASLLWVSVMWGAFNLLPVYPLDGGQIARYALIQFDPYEGARKALWLSVGAGGVMALFSLAYFGSLYMALLFAILAFQSYQALQGTRY